MRGKDLFEVMQNIDDALIEEAANESKCSKVLKIRRKTVLILAAAILLLLAACAAYVVVQWDSIFSNHFHPTQVEIRQTENGVQNVHAVSACDGYTLSVSQTLGDKQTIYIALDLTFPDSVDLSSILQKDPDGGWNLTILPDTLCFYHGATDYKEVKGMSLNEVTAYFAGRRYFGGSSTSVAPQSVDIESNTISYLLSFSLQNEELTDDQDDTITMMIYDLENEQDGTDHKIAAGPLVVCWSPENSGRVYQFDISDADEKLGTVTLSAFALDVELYSSKYQSSEELTQDVKIVMKNGEITPPSGSRGGSFSGPSGSISYAWQFRKILVLDEVDSIQVGDYCFKLDS